MIPKPEWRGRGWRRWDIGAGVSLRVSSWGRAGTFLTLDLPAPDEYGTWGALISRSQAVSILDALGRDRRQGPTPTKDET
jgi:hypothetical protein